MSNHTIMRLSYRPIVIIMFASGICIGSIIGLTFALINSASIGLFGGTFIALLTGLGSALLGLTYTAVFNTLAPAIGGMTLKLESLPITPKNTIDVQSPDFLSR